jgi:hypothetical protein
MAALVAILLPAVHAARETSRRSQCVNNLKNVGLAFINHHDVHRQFPTGGWGWLWTGDPDRGYGPRQPGGWLYNILPYMEEQVVHDLGRGLPEGSYQKRHFATQRIRTPMEWAVCPSRRRADLSPVTWQGIAQQPCINCLGPVKSVARSDYSVNCSDAGNNEFYGGPSSHRHGDTSFAWRDTRCAPGAGGRMCGISFERSQIAVRHIVDGLSKIYFVGERYLNSKKYDTGSDVADNEYMYVGFDNDMYKTADREPAGDGQLRNKSTGMVQDDSNRWGSAHKQAFHMVFGDGSVHAIPYEIDLIVHRRLANRRDGQAVAGGF